MIAEIFLGFIALGELLAFVGYVYLSNKDKTKLINALIAKDSQELFNLNMAEKFKVEKEKEPAHESDGIAVEDIPDDEYIDLITKSEDSVNG